MNKSISLRERQCLYFLQSTEIIGNITIAKLYSHFKSYESIYNAKEKELEALLTSKMLAQFISDRNSKDIAYEYSKLTKKNIRHYVKEDEEYPHRLLDLHDPPPAILVNGALPDINRPSVAIIGSRNCSNYGRSFASEYASSLSANGIQIISGMAMGIDGIAGQAAIKAGGRSFAVLGSGPDVCYPSTNKPLFDSLCINGGIISEYTLGIAGAGWHFPMRNRIIAALSDALLVIEAKEKSGTMITVDSALELGRDIYALPGRCYDVCSQGCNLLIKQGAQILISPEEFVSEFLTSMSSEPRFSTFFANISDEGSLTKQGPIFSTPEEQLVYNCLDYSPAPLDFILSKVNDHIPMPVNQLMIILTRLTIDGHVVCVGGNYAWK